MSLTISRHFMALKSEMDPSIFLQLMRLTSLIFLQPDISLRLPVTSQSISLIVSRHWQLDNAKRFTVIFLMCMRLTLVKRSQPDNELMSPMIFEPEPPMLMVSIAQPENDLISPVISGQLKRLQKRTLRFSMSP